LNSNTRWGTSAPMLSIRLVASALILSTTACSAAASSPGGRIPTAQTKPLKVASWNLEFLAERNGAGCNPRDDADYAAMRRIVGSLDADVIAFQEAESIAAAARIFDPASYTIVMEARPGAASGTCGGEHPDQKVIRQAVGFAVRKGIVFDRNADVTSLMIDNAQLRSGIDITLRPADRAPIRLLGIHLSRLAQSGDIVWTEIDDGEPANADLHLADAGKGPACDPRYTSFIDHIVLDKRAAADLGDFTETLYAPGEKHYSDHCPIAVTIAN